MAPCGVVRVVGGWGILPDTRVHNGYCTSCHHTGCAFVVILDFSQMPWTSAERVRMVELYHQTGSALQARRSFMREGNRRRGPSAKTIVRLVARLRTTGSVVEASRTRLPSPATKRAVKVIRRAIIRNPNLSVRGLARRTGVPRSTVDRVLRKWLRLHPYKLQRVHGLRRGDRAKRIRLARWLVQKLQSQRFTGAFFMSDEAHFYLDGTVGKANCRFWGTENPHETMDHDPYAPHVTAWCAISTRAIIGPYFFEERGHTVTVTALRYKAMLERFLVPELQRRGIPLRRVWFQQDGATSHTTRAVLDYLHEVFGARLLSKNTSREWPPRSPDLTIPDFFLWGWLKTEAYRTPLNSLTALKRRLRKLTADIPAATLAKLKDALVARLSACLRERGGPIEHLTLL